MNRSIVFSVAEWYHCYNRGVDKRKVFLDQKDYDRFLALLYLGNSREPVRIDNLQQNQQGGTLLERALKAERTETLVDIGAYCLMPNHFHLLLREKEDKGITEFMRKITTGYTMYFNKKEERTGALFGGTFKARHVANDRYFRRVVNYIHANSAELVEPRWKEGVVKNKRKTQEFLSSYPYSSLSDFTDAFSSETAALLCKEQLHDLYGQLPTLENLFADAVTFAKEESCDVYNGEELSSKVGPCRKM